MRAPVERYVRRLAQLMENQMLRFVEFREHPLRLFWLPVALTLWPVVAHDYYLRRIGARPDRWHWADALLYHMGYVVDA